MLSIKTLAHSTLADKTRLSWLDVEPSLDDLSIYQEQNTFESLMEHSVISSRVEKLLDVLTISVECRVTKQPEVCKNCVNTGDNGATKCNHCCVAVLFSGGLDSTVLALLAHRFVPNDKPIDLYNVAFQQRSGSFEVPDRETGQASLKELKSLAPNRLWNFVEVNVHGRIVLTFFLYDIQPPKFIIYLIINLAHIQTESDTLKNKMFDENQINPCIHATGIS